MAERTHAPAEHDTPAPDEHVAPAGPVLAPAAATLLKLQRTAGNHAVIALLAEARPKLEVGASDDPAEREADRVAKAVVAGEQPPIPLQSAGRARARRAPQAGAVGAEGGRVAPEVEQALEAAGGGQLLPERTRATMEQAMGADLSAVRTHVGPTANALSRTLSAKAFTVGDDIFFRDNLPSADSVDGRGLLAHELAHTMQPRDTNSVHRLYVETDDVATKDGSIDIDGKLLHYKWDASAQAEQLENTGKTVRGWLLKNYPVYRKKAAPKPAAATPTPATPAATPAPIVLGAKNIKRLDALIVKLADWAKLGDKVDKFSRDQRRGLANEAKAMKEGRIGRPFQQFAADVTRLETTFDDAQKRVDAARKLEAEEQVATAERERQTAVAEALDAKLLGLCGGQPRLFAELTRGFGTSVKLEAALKLAPALTLQPLLSSFTGATIMKLLEHETDKGTRLRSLQRNVVAKDDPTSLLATANKITPAQLMTLLTNTKSSTLVELAPLVKSGAVLVRMRLGAATEDAFSVNVKGMVGAGWDVAAADTAAGAADTAATAAAAAGTAPAEAGKDAFATDLKAQKKTIGLVGENGVEIELRAVKGMSGDGLGGEESAIEKALAAIDAGKAPIDKVVEKRVLHDNRDLHLPGARGVKRYQEWGIKPPKDVAWPAKRRLVVDEDVADVAKRPVFYTWTHYGQDGETPAFVRIR